MTDRSVSSSLSGTTSVGASASSSRRSGHSCYSSQRVDHHRKLRYGESIIGASSSSSSEEMSDSDSERESDSGLNIMNNEKHGEAQPQPRNEGNAAISNGIAGTGSADQTTSGKDGGNYAQDADREAGLGTLGSTAATHIMLEQHTGLQSDLASLAISGPATANTGSADNNASDVSSGADLPTGQLQDERQTPQAVSLNQSLDEEGVALLGQIFPETPQEELEAIHMNRLESLNGSMICSRVGSFVVGVDGDSSRSDDSDDDDIINRNERLSATRIRSRRRQRGAPFQLPPDFLSIPPSTSVQILSADTNRMEWKLISDLEAEVFAKLGMAGYEFASDGQYLSTVLQRKNDSDSLGMTLRNYDGMVCVHALASSSVAKTGEGVSSWSGTAYEAGVRVGDEILGINGVAVPIGAAARSTESSLPFAVEMLRSTDNIIILHLHRGHIGGAGTRDEEQSIQMSNSTKFGEPSHSAHDTTTTDRLDNGYSAEEQPSDPEIHPLAALLLERGILRSKEEAILTTQQLDEYTERARQWEATSALCVDASDYSLRVVDAEGSSKKHSPQPSGACTPSTPVRRPRRPLSAAQDGARGFSSPSFASPPPSSLSLHQTSAQRYPGKTWTNGGEDSFSTPKQAGREARIEMGVVRKGLCVRILNSFDDGNKTCYTVWCYDCESSTEWYAPARYLQDFDEMRNQCIHLYPLISQFPFASKIWLPVVSVQLKEARLHQLERFLRAMCAIFYKLPLHPNIVEVAFYLQSFLGCDARGGGISASSLPLHHQATSNRKALGGVDDGHNEEEREARSKLSNAIQRYVYRIFLLPSIEAVSSHFVDTIKSEIPSVAEMRELERRGLGFLKDRAFEILGKVQLFIGSIQAMIIDACKEDMLSIASRDDYSSLRERIESKTGELYSQLFFRGEIRKQMELEVYIPLRKAISTVLVNAWRHDDMSLTHKINVLARQPQSYFNLAQESPTGWSSVIAILKEGVGRSSLPCQKLSAIVDASKEIIRLLRMNGQDSVDGLGADEFLPVLVYCVVMAGIERPCALCELLQQLADERSMLGEVGYYFSSFQASITHIQELALTSW